MLDEIVNLNSYSYMLTERFQSRRDFFLKAARAVVSEGGFQGLQMLTVAHAAGSAVGSLYRYFPSKADLCAALVARVSEREVAVLSFVADTDDDPGQRLADCVATFARRALRNRRLAYAMIAEPVDEAVDAVRLKYRAAISIVFQRLIEQGRRDGRFRAVDARLAAACITGAFMEALVGPLAPDNAEDALNNDFVDQLAALCLAMIALSGASPLRLTVPSPNARGLQ